MKRFSFRLERVLQLRLSAEQERARALLEAREAEAAARARAAASAAQLVESTAQLATTASDLRTAGTMSNLLLAVEAAAARAAVDAAAQRDAAAALEVTLAAYEEARQARRAIERLKEQRQASWEQEVARTEQHLLDEVALRKLGGRNG